MDKLEMADVLGTALGATLAPEALDRFVTYGEELARFGAKLNLTAIKGEREVLDKHFADSLLVSRAVGPGSLIDVGTGAGFPGVPLAIVRSDLDVTLVDAAKKKVGFLKALLAALGLQNARAVHARLGREPVLGQFDSAVARALVAPVEWIRLARPHVRHGGRVVAMLASEPNANCILAAAEDGARLAALHPVRLPLSGDGRVIAVFEMS